MNYTTCTYEELTTAAYMAYADADRTTNPETEAKHLAKAEFIIALRNELFPKT